MFNFASALGGKGITKEEAQKRFDEYYEDKSPAYVAMAKKRDAEVSKSGKYLLIPKEKGSEKYLQENGVKYYDMLGVDAFETDTFFMKDIRGKRVKYNTKKIATKKDGETYSEFNKKQYKINRAESKDRVKHIVNYRWIKEYEKRIVKLKEKLETTHNPKDKKELKQKIKKLKDNIKNLKLIDGPTHEDDFDDWED